MLKEYYKRQLQRDDNPPEAEPLLSVGRQQAEKWVKKVFRDRNEGFEKGRFSEETIAISNDLNNVLYPPNVPDNGALPVNALRIADKTAATRDEKKYTPPPAPKPQICWSCGKPTGKGPGLAHVRGKCPEETAEARARRVAKNEARLAKKRTRKEYESGLNERRTRASELFKIKGWMEFLRTQVKTAHVRCDVCCYQMPKSMPTEHRDWHFIKYNMAEYCPYADGEEKREEAIQQCKHKY
jgi:hypothetical protein